MDPNLAQVLTIAITSGTTIAVAFIRSRRRSGNGKTADNDDG